MKKLLLTLVTISMLATSCFASALEDESNYRAQKIFDLELQVEMLENRENELQSEIKYLRQKLEETKRSLSLKEAQVKYLMEHRN